MQHHTNSPYWIHGWNVTTRLYIILEHAVGEYRRRASKYRPSSAPQSSNEDINRGVEAVKKLRKLYDELSPQFKAPQPISPDVRGCQDYRMGLQAATIAVAMQLTLLIIFTCQGFLPVQTCSVADVLQEILNQIPPHFLHASSCPLIHQIAGLGYFLALEVKCRPPDKPSYTQVCDVL